MVGTSPTMTRESRSMSLTDLAATIDAAWKNRAEIGLGTKGAVREAVEQAIEMLDAGKARVAEKIDVA